MAISIPGRAGSGADVEELRKAIQQQLTALQTQLNSAPTLTSPVNGTFSNSPAAGSLNARTLSDGSIALSQYTAQGLGQEVVVASQPASASTYVPPQAHAGAPTAASNFPTAGNFGWYKNTTSGNWYFTLNFGGSLIFQDLSTFTGNINDSQHGSRSGGTLHANATDSVAGFMSATDKTNFDAGVTLIGSITGSGAASTTLNATAFLVNGTQVVGARNTGWSVSGAHTTNKAATINSGVVSTTQLGDLLYTLLSTLISQGIIGA